VTLRIPDSSVRLARHADRVLTVNDWLVDFNRIPPWRRQTGTGSGVTERFRCGGRDLSTDCDWPRLAQSISAVAHIGTAPADHFRSAVATVKNAWNRLAIHLTVGIHRKTAFHVLGTAQKRHLHLWAHLTRNGRTLIHIHVRESDCPDSTAQYSLVRKHVKSRTCVEWAQLARRWTVRGV